jgi:hypothetical protein
MASPESASDSFPDEGTDASDPIDSAENADVDCSSIFFVTVATDVETLLLPHPVTVNINAKIIQISLRLLIFPLFTSILFCAFWHILT